MDSRIGRYRRVPLRDAVAFVGTGGLAFRGLSRFHIGNRRKYARLINAICQLTLCEAGPNLTPQIPFRPADSRPATVGDSLRSVGSSLSG